MKHLITTLAFLTTLLAPLTAAADCHFVRIWQCRNGFCQWQEVWNCLPACRRVCRTEADEWGNTRWFCTDVCR